jgi:protein-tyrosine phosphatase
MTHLRIPIREFDDDDLIRRLRPAARCVDELLRVGHRLYLHCNAGLERSPSVAVAYLVWYRNLALGEALAAVSAGRPCRPREWALKRVLGGDG